MLAPYRGERILTGPSNNGAFYTIFRDASDHRNNNNKRPPCLLGILIFKKGGFKPSSWFEDFKEAAE